jgi:hypothetical protein
MSITDFTISQMRSKVTFKSNAPIQDDSGGLTDVFTTLVVTRGRLRKQSGAKTLESGELRFNSDYELICRYQNQLLIDPNAIVEIGGVDFRIKEYQIVDQIKHMFIFILSVFE